MINLTLEDIKEMLEQLKYSDIKKVDDGIYSAKNFWGDTRSFTTIYEDGNIILYADRSITNLMKNKLDFQVFEIEFVSEGFTTILSDYLLKGNNIEDLIPKPTPREKMDIGYK